MKKLFLATAAASVAVPAVRAQILLTTVGETIAAPGGAIYLDLDGGTYSFSPSGQLALTFLATDKLRSVSSDSWYVAAGNPSGNPASNYEGLARFFGSTSDPVSVDVPRADTFLENPDALTGYKGYWDYSAPMNGYLGLQNTDGRKAWVHLDYNDPGNTLSVIDFGVAPNGYDLHHGETSPVPEPAETAAIMALLAGSAAAYHRRRKVKAAA